LDIVTEKFELVLSIQGISISYEHVASFNKKNGCPVDSSTPSADVVPATDRFSMLVELSIINEGSVDFKPPQSFIGPGECANVINDFYYLDFKGVTLKRYGSCIVDDSNYIDKSSCTNSASFGIITTSTPNAGYGLKRKIVVHFPLSDSQYSRLIEDKENSFPVTVSLNNYIALTTKPVTLDIKIGDKLDGLEMKSAWKINPNVYHPPVQLYSKLFARYSAGTFTVRSNSWSDISGNHRDASVVSGSVVVGTDEFGNSIISGDTSTVIQFPTGDVGTAYTIFYRAKYTSIFNKRRILTGQSTTACNNWLSGFWMGRVGVSYHGTFITDDNKPPSRDWLVSTDQLNLYRANGVDYTTSKTATCALPNLGINLMPNERSDWAVSDVIIYSSELSTAEIKIVEASLHSGVALSPSPQPSYS